MRGRKGVCLGCVWTQCSWWSEAHRSQERQPVWLPVLQLGQSKAFSDRDTPPATESFHLCQDPNARSRPQNSQQRSYPMWRKLVLSIDSGMTNGSFWWTNRHVLGGLPWDYPGDGRLGRNHLHTLQVLCGSYSSSQLRPLWHQQHHRGLFAHNDICILCLVLWIDPNCIVPDCSMNLAAGPATKLPDTDSPDLASQSTGKDHDHRLSRSICFERERRGTVWSISGWWWLEPWNFLTFHILGMSWSQLTFIFFRGVDIPLNGLD